MRRWIGRLGHIAVIAAMLGMVGRNVVAQPKVASSRPDASLVAGSQGDRTDAWRWVRFGREDGLPSEIVGQIAESGDGTIWAGTEEGLVWFDGVRWRPARMPLSTPPHAPVWYLRRDAQGGVIAFVGRAVVRWNGPTSAPQVLMSQTEDEAWASAIVDRSGTLWVTAASHPNTPKRHWHLWSVSPSGRRDEGWPTTEEPVDGVSPRLFVDAEGRVVLGTGADLFRRSDRTWTRIVRLAGVHANILHYQNEADGETRVVLATTDSAQGVWAIGPSTGTPERWTQFPEFEHEAPTAFQYARNGTATAVLQAGDLLFCDGNGWRRLFAGVPAAIATSTALTYDQFGDVWFATRKGIVLWRRSSDRWMQWRRPEASADNRVNAIAAGPNGDVVAATAGGLNHLGVDGRLLPEPGLGHTVFTSAAFDTRGHLWAGSGGAFPGVMVRRGGVWVRRVTPTGLAQTFIHKIVRLRNGDLVLLGLPTNGARGGAWQVHEDSVWLMPLSAEAQAARFYDATETSDGTVWFATQRGLLRWKNQVETLVPLRGRPENEIAYAVAPAQEGGVWVGYRPSGVHRIAADLTEAPSEGGDYPRGATWALAADGERVWASNSDGLWVRVNGRWSLLTASFGLPTPAIWPLLPVDGDLYIGTLGAGVLRLDLETLNRAHPRVELRESVDLSDGVRVVWTAATERGVVPPEDITTRWRLDDGPWSQWSSATELALTLRLPWQRHRLEIEARTPLGVTSETPLALEFVTPPPPWLRAQMVGPVLLLLALLAMVALALWRRRRQAAQLSLRLRDAERMELVGNFAAGMAHEFNNLLTSVVVNADLVTDAAPPAAGEPSPALEIQRAALAAAEQVRMLMSFTRDQSFSFGVLDLRAELARLRPGIDVLFDAAVQKRWILGEAPVLVRAESDGLVMMMRALAENARDAMSGAGTFEVSLDVVAIEGEAARRLGVPVETSTAQLRVRDTGSGISAEVERRIFEPYYTTRTQHAGLGLALVYGLSRRFGGLVEIAETGPHGTTVRVLFPLAR